MRMAMAVISASVVARLLPSATTTLPSLSKFSWLMPTIFANRAKLVAASSAVRLVATERSAIVAVNSSMLSTSMPS